VPRPPDDPKTRHRRRPVLASAYAFLLIVAGPFISVLRTLRNVARDPETQNILTASALLLLSGVFIFRWLEDLGWIDALYFSFITLSTIGYGDISPTTDAGKIATIVYSIVGLGILAALIKAIATHTGSSRHRAARRTDPPTTEGPDGP